MAAQKFALVTGGNRGIGFEVCKALVAKGKPVLLTTRNVAEGQKIAESLTQGAPAAVVKSLELDVGDSSSIQKLAALVKEEYNAQIDLLVNNAGILFKQWDQQAFESTLQVNTKGPIQLSQALLPFLAPGALIVMVSSGLGQLQNLSPDYRELVEGASSVEDLQGIAFKPDSAMGSGGAPEHGSYAPTYTVAKAALNKAVKLMAADESFKSRGVGVVTTCPGWCRTDMGSQAAHRSAEQGALSVLWPYLNWKDSLNASFTKDGEAMAW